MGQRNITEKQFICLRHVVHNTVKYLSVIIHRMNTFGSQNFYTFSPSQFVSMHLLTLYSKNKLKGHENKKGDHTQ